MLDNQSDFDRAMAILAQEKHPTDAGSRKHERDDGRTSAVTLYTRKLPDQYGQMRARVTCVFGQAAIIGTMTDDPPMVAEFDPTPEQIDALLHAAANDERAGNKR